jgi:hypothetical protein
MYTYNNYLDFQSPSARYENPIKMLIIRVNVAMKNNYPKPSGIKRKLPKLSAL